MAAGTIPMIVRQPSDQNLSLGLSSQGISQRKYNVSFPPPIPEPLPGQVIFPGFDLGVRSIITTIQQGAERQYAITEAAIQNRRLWLLRSFEERMDGVADEYAEEENETTEWWMLEEVLYGSNVTDGSYEVRIRYEDLVHEGMPLKPDTRYCITLPLHNKTRISCDVPCDGESDSENGQNQATRQEDSDSEDDTPSTDDLASPSPAKKRNLPGDLKTNIETVHEGKKINDNGKDIACVPNELVVKILSNLGIRDISVCKRVNRTWKELIDESHLQARSFCLDCPPPAGLYSPQKAVERYHSSTRNWLTCFSDKGKELAERLGQLLMHKYFPEELFFSVAKVLCGTQVLLCQNIRTIQHTDELKTSFSSDGYHFVTASDYNTVKIWELVDGQWQEKTTIQHAGSVNNASFSPDGYHLVTTSDDDTAKIWGFVDGQWQEKATIQHTDCVNSASFSHDGCHLVTASGDHTTKIWGLVDGQWQEKNTIQHIDWVNNASFSPDGYHLVTVYRYHTAKIWGVVDGQWREKATIQHTFWLSNVSFSSDANHIVTAYYDHTARIWGLVDGQWQAKTAIQHTYWVNSASFSPDGNHLVTASDDHTAEIWGLVDGQWQEKATIQHTGCVNSASFSPDGKHLVTASNDHTAKIWGLVDGQWQEKAIIQHAYRVGSASFSPYGNHLVTASRDHTAKIWGLVDGQWQEKASIHAAYVNSASFSPDGYHLVTVSGFNTANIWVLKSCHSLF